MTSFHTNSIIKINKETIIAVLLWALPSRIRDEIRKMVERGVSVLSADRIIAGGIHARERIVVGKGPEKASVRVE